MSPSQKLTELLRLCSWRHESRVRGSLGRIADCCCGRGFDNPDACGELGRVLTAGATTAGRHRLNASTGRKPVTW